MRFAIALAATFLAYMLSGCAQQSGPRLRGPIQFAQNPSVILALDIAQNRLAQEKDAYAALLATAAENAVTFVPEPIEARPWLKTQAPLKNTRWKPHRVFMSCDGKTGVTTGEIKWGDVDGYYTTVWQFFQKADGTGDWRWLLSHGDRVEMRREAPEFLQTTTASCKGGAGAPLNAPPEGATMKMGLSRDQSLNYTWIVQKDKSRTLEVGLWNGSDFDMVLLDKVAAPKAP
jgi:hypothetical protein